MDSESDARAALKRYELSGVEVTGRRLGDGSYCVVVEVEYKGVKYAAKYLNRLLINTASIDEGIAIRKKCLEEVFLHSQLDHPSIIQFIGVYYERTDTVKWPVLVMELLPTTLADYLDQHGVPPNETIYSILRDVVLGLQYLHEHHPPIMHRDLTANNVLLTGDLHAKINDFGVAKTLTPGVRARAMTRCPGTPSYMPPEAMIRDPHYGTEIDIFSYGALILHVCSGRWPNPGKRIALTEVERRQEYLDQMGANHPLRSLTVDCLSYDPSDRPTAAQVLYRLQEVISGIQDSRRLFDEAMKCGYVEARLIVLLLIGAAGAGKTHAKHLFLGLPPPVIRQSTPLAEEAIRAISTLRAMVSGTSDMVWEPVTLEKLKQMIAEAVKARESQGRSIPSPERLLQVTPVAEPRASIGEPNVATQPRTPPRGLPEHTSLANSFEPSLKAPPPVPPSKHKQEEELVDLVMSSSGSRKLFGVEWVYLVDSGGQPTFHELLNLFVHNASAVAFVAKLNERLSDKPTVKWYGKDGRKYSTYSSPFTNEEILRHCIRGMRSRQSPSQGETGPQIFVLGTHKDLEHTCDESRMEKNAALLKMLRPLEENLAYFSIANPEELIFPVNAKEPTDEDRKVAERFRRAVSKCSEARVEIPLPWYVLEQYIRQLVAELHRKVLRTSECAEEAKKLHMNEEACEAALVYLDKLNMFLYRPDHLKGLVFCGSQVWLDKISELSELIDRLQGRSDASPGSADPETQLPGRASEPSDSGPCGTVPSDPVTNKPPDLATHRNSRRQSILGWFRSLFQPQPQGQTHNGPPVQMHGSSVNPRSVQMATHDASDQPNTHLEYPVEDLHFQYQTNESRSSHIAFPDLSEFCDSEGVKFRDHGIVTVNILVKFPQHYVEGLFTPAELLKLLTAFLVTAPICEGSPEYVMPCLLRELAPHKLDKHRQLDPSSPAAPLLIQFPDNWVPAGVFTVLIAYLQSVAHWKLCRSSGSPDCLHRNCAKFYLPTGHGGSVTLVDSFEYLEVHVVDASDRACQKVCPRIVEDLFRGIEEAACRLHYGTLQLDKAFLCPTPTPDCQVDPHLAEVVDDELVCSVSERKTGELTDRHKVWHLRVGSKEDSPLLGTGISSREPIVPPHPLPSLLSPHGQELRSYSSVVTCPLPHRKHHPHYPGITFFGNPLQESVDSQGGTLSCTGLSIELVIPPDAVPHGRVANVMIWPCLSGPFVPPEGYEIMSPVFLISSTFKFKKEVQLVLQHFASLPTDSECSRMKFVSASSSPSLTDNCQQYHFRDPKQGAFQRDSQIGTVSLKHFSLNGVAKKKGEQEKDDSPMEVEEDILYSVQVYQIPVITERKLHVVFSVCICDEVRLEDLKKTLEAQYPGVRPLKIVKHPATLTKSEVQLEIPTTVSGWIIVSLSNPCTITQKEVDFPRHYPKGCLLREDYPPRIFLSAKPEGPTAQPTTCTVTVHGVAEMDDFKLSLSHTAFIESAPGGLHSGQRSLEQRGSPATPMWNIHCHGPAQLHYGDLLMQQESGAQYAGGHQQYQPGQYRPPHPGMRHGYRDPHSHGYYPQGVYFPTPPQPYGGFGESSTLGRNPVPPTYPPTNYSTTTSGQYRPPHPGMRQCYRDPHSHGYYPQGVYPPTPPQPYEGFGESSTLGRDSTNRTSAATRHGFLGGASMTKHPVWMRGLPYGTNEADVIEFFSPHVPISVNITFDQYHMDRWQAGVAQVQFGTQENAVLAMKKDRSFMDRHCIELSLVPFEVPSQQHPYSSGASFPPGGTGLY